MTSLIFSSTFDPCAYFQDISGFSRFFCFFRMCENPDNEQDLEGERMFRNKPDFCHRCVLWCDTNLQQVPWCFNSESSYLFGPGGFVAGVARVLVVIELLLLGRSRVLLLLLLEGNQVSSLLLELSLKPLRLPLLLQLLPLILLQRNTHGENTENQDHITFLRSLYEMDMDVLD